jgi:hypothetical protein
MLIGFAAGGGRVCVPYGDVFELVLAKFSS